MSDVLVEQDGHVAVVALNRPPANHFDLALVRTLADRLEELAATGTRAAVLTTAGKHFCAGADLGTGDSADERVEASTTLYREALRLLGLEIPVVAAIRGAAVGGGLGLACAADFRVAVPTARLHANFAALGFHQGFGLSVTLPRIVGGQRAAELLYTARKVDGTEALRIGLADRLAPGPDPLPTALELAEEIAAAAPLAVRSMKATLRGDLVDRVARATEHELVQQSLLWRTEDCAAGIAASLTREAAVFHGR